MRKYELTNRSKMKFGKRVYQIVALKSFGNVEAGDLGGWIEKESNLSQDGNAWVYSGATVSGNAWVYGDASVSGNAWVHGNAWVLGNAWVSGEASVFGNAWVSDNAWVAGNANIYGNASLIGDAWIFNDVDHKTIYDFGDIATFFRCRDESIRVKCGNFQGKIDEFKRYVKEHYVEKLGEKGLLIVDMMKKHFN